MTLLIQKLSNSQSSLQDKDASAEATPNDESLSTSFSHLFEMLDLPIPSFLNLLRQSIIRCFFLSFLRYSVA